MKKIIIYLLLLFCMNELVAAEKQELKKAHLFILSGQSNMRRLNPDLTFTPTLKKAFPSDEIIVIKDAKGGQPIRFWSKPAASARNDHTGTSGVLYDRLIRKVKIATAKSTFDTVTFIWMQGESDAAQNHADTYEASLLAVIDQLKKDLGREDLNFVIGRLSDFGLERKKFSSSWEMIRKVQVQVATTGQSHGAWVDTDDLNGDKNDLHYTSDGYDKLGERFASSAIKLIMNK